MFRLSMLNVLCGAAFGAALERSGVYLPNVIISQMQLQKFDMLGVFVTASACNAVLMSFLEWFGWFKRSPKPPASIGLFSKYDANVIGGAMVGIGMSLTGACPGTVFVQMVAGVKSSVFIFTGAVAGAIIHYYLPPLQQKHMQIETVDSKLTMSYGTMATFYAAICATAIYFTPNALLSNNPAYLHHVLGGLVISSVQGLTMLITSSPIGVSTVYSELAARIVAIIDWHEKDTKSINSHGYSNKAMLFAGGILFGSFVSLKLSSPGENLISNFYTSPSQAFLGGAIMVLGARLAGGCTSGHGISGMAQMALSSFITVAAMFSGGICAAFWLRKPVY